MAVTGAAIASRTEGGHRVTNYIKAHWKELLALLLAAIPAAFIIFSVAGRKTAQQTLSLAPNSSVPAADPGTTIQSPSTGNSVATAGNGPGPTPGTGPSAKTMKALADKVKAHLPPLNWPPQGPGDKHGPPLHQRRSVNGSTGINVKAPPRTPVSQVTVAKRGTR